MFVSFNWPFLSQKTSNSIVGSTYVKNIKNSDVSHYTSRNLTNSEETDINSLS